MKSCIFLFAVCFTVSAIFGITYALVVGIVLVPLTIALEEWMKKGKK